MIESIEMHFSLLSFFIGAPLKPCGLDRLRRRSLRPVTTQRRQSAWQRRADRRAPGMPADGGARSEQAARTAPLAVHTHTHTHTHTELSTVALCTNSQAGSAPTRLSHRLIIATRVESERR